jgi:hypothetical protein
MSILETTKDFSLNSVNPISVSNEKRAWATIHELAISALKGYPTTISEDESIL